MFPTFEDQNPVHSVSEWTGFWSSKVGKYYITIVSKGRISLSIRTDLHLHLQKTAFCRSGWGEFHLAGRISLSIEFSFVSPVLGLKRNAQYERITISIFERPRFVVLAVCQIFMPRGSISLSSSAYLVFKSPVWSGFLMPLGLNRNRNQSAFFPKVKRPNRTAKNHGLHLFAVYRPVLVFFGFNRFKTGFLANILKL
ncbi:uncharacterized protein LACBIDRAFT_332065 [Laccaria bicolor S238N-H82]|uniref:Predicted protein n=1 Tax=Laccaria bicolor (strain S238N-H82 / ATCC MYA-4686) TaxID=486041 RepID=B0DRG5_LACBS|nr:uncharacterized protein LACBIDRAFT_332065 [Laccaria bicolor S238N-H82]EDR02779.1 predicted protein [Laccaria bicolor S238N-H82]|eukprot:XP_001886489.1 predicted protein [Laccaria bicolor S238N-H82]